MDTATLEGIKIERSAIDEYIRLFYKMLYAFCRVVDTDKNERVRKVGKNIRKFLSCLYRFSIVHFGIQFG